MKNREIANRIAELHYPNEPNVIHDQKYRVVRMKTLADQVESELNLLTIPRVSNWVAISSTEHPEIMTDVMVKYKDGRKEVAYFDGDKRFYIEKDDRDITETIVEWHKLP